MDDCSNIPALGYAEFSDWLRRLVGDQRIPVSGSIDVTMRCNLRCQHCYIPCETRAAQSEPEPELSLAEIQRMLDEFADAGCFWLLLTGGEPFLRKDFLDIYAHAKRKGMVLTIFTNGTLLTPQTADYLRNCAINWQISLYGATQATYERVTGIPG